MNSLTHSLKISLLTCAVTLTAISPVMADDSEVYTGAATFSNEVRPNLTFIIDTSGSMDTNVTTITTNGTYNPATTYTGSCNSSRIYWSTNGTPPECDDDEYFLTTANKCNAVVSSLNTAGFASAVRAARYRNRNGEDRWESLNDNNHDDYVECAADWGTHGQSGATNPYPADEDENGPWRSNATNAINWNNTGQIYTFYSANYLNWFESTATVVTQTRLQIVKDVFTDVIDSLSNNINLAVMRFDQDANGGYFVMPMQQLNHDPSTGNATAYKDAVNDMNAGGNTPLAETLYESYLFYRGDAVHYGDDSEPGTNHSGVFTGGTYDTPIEYQCQKNFVILLTDGEPTSDTGADDEIEDLEGFSGVTGASSCSGNCLDELAQYMNVKDCQDPELPGRQNVITYTIGFQSDQALLSAAAEKGGGQYYTANDTSDLTNAFTSILTDIMAINTTFVAPAVSVNAFNRTTHRDELYYAIFKPDNRPYWKGNLKQFKLAFDNNNDAVIVDQNGNLAVDPNTGYFYDSATSFWTASADAPDGGETGAGGAASRITLPRTIYTYTSATAPSNSDLTASTHALHESNILITKDMLGDATMTDDERTEILQWARGVDVHADDADEDTADARRFMGDPLHAQPKVVSYGGTADAPDITIFMSTNEGNLTAIDADDGSEVFTFMPQEVLPNLATFVENNAGDDHPYGVDGPLTTWINDLNDNGVIYNTSGTLETDEFVYLYQGMRRGGNNYYALDVTDRSTPRLKWVVKGGLDDTDYAEMGQTWSAPKGGRIKIGGTDQVVMIVGGGYDPNQDTVTTRTADAIGRAVYFIDANTGAKLWEAGGSGTRSSSVNEVFTAMQYSIPSDITTLDTNGDGYLDRMYVGDMGGQLWRFDIHNGNAVDSLVTGGVIATLSDTTEAGNRRFYNAPDISLSSTLGYLNIAFGSGFRAHPLDTDIHDAVFVIRDHNVFTVPGTYTSVSMGSLYDATENLIAEGGDATEISTAQSALSGGPGFYIWLNEADLSFVGEKALSEALIFDGKVAISTFTPVASASAACAPNQGVGKLYLFNIEDGRPVTDFNAVTSPDSETLTRADRAYILTRGGIPPTTTLLNTKNDSTGGVESTMISGTEIIPEGGKANRPQKVYWWIQ